MESYNNVEIIYPNENYDDRKKKVTKYHLVGFPMAFASFFLSLFSIGNCLKYYYQDNKMFYYLFCILSTLSVICLFLSFILTSMDIEERVSLAYIIKDLKIYRLNINKEKLITEFILIDKNDEVMEYKVDFLEFVYKVNIDKPLLNLEESKLYIPYEENESKNQN